MKNVLLLKAGETAPSVRLSVGDYERWFLQTLGLEAESVARGVPRGEQVPRLLAGLAPTPAGRRILLNFLQHFT